LQAARSHSAVQAKRGPELVFGGTSRQWLQNLLVSRSPVSMGPNSETYGPKPYSLKWFGSMAPNFITSMGFDIHDPILTVGP
jgi:hypothetical protein